MYVIRYMKLMRTRTSQRVREGWEAEFSTVTALVDADVPFMSGILAPDGDFIKWK
jgi:hypothetical protein